MSELLLWGLLGIALGALAAFVIGYSGAKSHLAALERETDRERRIQARERALELRKTALERERANAVTSREEIADERSPEDVYRGVE